MVMWSWRRPHMHLTYSVQTRVSCCGSHWVHDQAQSIWTLMFTLYSIRARCVSADCPASTELDLKPAFLKSIGINCVAISSNFLFWILARLGLIGGRPLSRAARVAVLNKDYLSMYCFALVVNPECTWIFSDYCQWCSLAPIQFKDLLSRLIQFIEFHNGIIIAVQSEHLLQPIIL